MTKYSGRTRLKAALAFEWARHDKKEAAQRFRQTYHGSLPTRPGDFCQDWHARLCKQLDVQDAPRPGRPRRVGDESVRAVLEQFLKGWPKKSQWQGWKSFRVAIRNDKKLRRLVKKVGLKTRQLFTRMKLVGGWHTQEPSCAAMHSRKVPCHHTAAIGRPCAPTPTAHLCQP